MKRVYIETHHPSPMWSLCSKYNSLHVADAMFVYSCGHSNALNAGPGVSLVWVGSPKVLFLSLNTELLSEVVHLKMFHHGGEKLSCWQKPVEAEWVQIKRRLCSLV